MKVCWVKIWIASMATITERFRDDEGRVDFEALGREEYAFRHALITGDYCKSERARDLAEAAEKDYKIHSENGKKGGRPKKLTADASTREGEDERQHPSDGELLESGTSANHYDQETKVSTKAPLRPGAGEVPPENVSAKPSPALPISAKRPHGEFGNIMLTDDEYAKLCKRFSFAGTVIEEADQYFEAQPAKKKKYKNHYAMLLNWCKRRETEAKPQQRYKNINDINQENYEKAMREIEAMCAGEAV